MADQVIMQPIFRPLKDKWKPFGMPIPKLLATTGVAFLGFLLSLALGNWTHAVEVKYTQSEYNALVTEYTAVQANVANLEAQRKLKGLSSIEDLELNMTQLDRWKRAKEIGITPATTEEQAIEMVPASHTVQEPVLPQFPRNLVLVGGPFVVGIGLFIEIQRTSLYSELKRRIRYEASQKKYRNAPIEYVERETRGSYWAAVEEDER